MRNSIFDERYEIASDQLGTDLNDFFRRAVATKIPVEVVDLKPGQLISIPASVDRKTIVTYAGKAPFVNTKPDKFKNIQIRVSEASVIEVIFTSEKVGAVGKNRGPHQRKIVYTVK